MSDISGEQQSGRITLGHLVTTGVVSAMTAFAASLLFFHFFPQSSPVTHPLLVVDIVKLGASIAKVDENGGDSKLAADQAGQGLKALMERGYLVLDSRYVVTAPEHFYIQPQDLIANAPAIDAKAEAQSGYQPPILSRLPQPAK
ncbi:MAG: hypothetical protein IJ164_00230 [Duodenibacillus sp.]|nr:hypothetical protein [Duodenibacillus sp.]